MQHNGILKALRRDPAFLEAERELGPSLDLANLIIISREQKGLTQRDLAAIVGVDTATIDKIENGIMFNQSALNKIVSFLDIKS